VSTIPPADDDLLPAERRVAELLGTLRSDPPSSPASLTGSVVRRARWQAAVKPPLRAVGMFASALYDGAKLLFGGGKRDPRP
jgi:hypothetical protein